MTSPLSPSQSPLKMAAFRSVKFEALIIAAALLNAQV
jgi:hypothetical protein